MTASLDGDGSAYHALLKRLTGHLRAYYRHRFALIGHGPTEAEDLLQEALIAIHTHRNTYDRLRPFTPGSDAIARYKFLDYLRRTKSSFKDMPITNAEELTAKSDFVAIESGLDLQRLMSKISSKAREVIISEAGRAKRERGGDAMRNVRVGGKGNCASWTESVGVADSQGELSMNTDRLIDILSVDAEPVNSGQLGKMLILAIGASGAAALGLMLATVGPRPDLQSTAHLEWTAVKLLYALSVLAHGGASPEQIGTSWS